MEKPKGIIRSEIHEAFNQYREDRNLRIFARRLVHVADYSVHCAEHASIMYEQINKETESEE